MKLKNKLIPSLIFVIALFLFSGCEVVKQEDKKQAVNQKSVDKRQMTKQKGGESKTLKEAQERALYSTMIAILPTASMCLKEGGTLSLPQKEKRICKGVSSILETWPPTFSSGLAEEAEYVYGTVKGDVFTVAENGKVVIKCDVSDMECEMID